MFNKFVKSIKKNYILILFKIIIDNNVNVNFSILTRELLLIF